MTYISLRKRKSFMSILKIGYYLSVKFIVMHFVIVPSNLPYASIYFDSIQDLFSFLDNYISMISKKQFRSYSLFRCPYGLHFYAKHRFDFTIEKMRPFYISQLDYYIFFRSMYNTRYRKYLKYTYYGIQA